MASQLLKLHRRNQERHLSHRSPAIQLVQENLAGLEDLESLVNRENLDHQ